MHKEDDSDEQEQQGPSDEGALIRLSAEQVHPITTSKKAIATSGQNGDEVEYENDVQEESAAEEVATVVAGS